MEEKTCLDKWLEVVTCIIHGYAPEFENNRSDFNKDMIQFKWYIKGYLDVEEYLKHTTKRTLLPNWIPIGGREND